jgi:hypothetical protein
MLNADDPTVASRLIEVEQGLRARLQQELGFSLVEKQSDTLSKAIAWSLDGATLVHDVVQTFGVDIPLAAPSGKSFLEGFATTIGPRIAMPEAWLASTGSAAATRLFVFPHEWQHVKQFHDGAAAGKWPKITSHSVLYLAGVVAHTPDGEEYVGKVEGDAYAVSANVRRFFAGSPGEIDSYLASIRLSYNLLSVGPVMAEDVLKSHFATMAANVCPPVTAARISQEYLYKHAGDLRGKVAL